MSDIPNKHVQAYHIRQAYVEILKRGCEVTIEDSGPNAYMVTVSLDGHMVHKFKLRHHDE